MILDFFLIFLKEENKMEMIVKEKKKSLII